MNVNSPTNFSGDTTELFYLCQNWTANIDHSFSGAPFHDVAGIATIIDGNSLRVDHFFYDGNGPLVYFWLGTEDTRDGFLSGGRIGPKLNGTVFSDDTVIIDLPAGDSLDSMTAFSVWCENVNANFGSGVFVCPYTVSGDITGNCTTDPLDPSCILD